MISMVTVEEFFMLAMNENSRSRSRDALTNFASNIKRIWVITSIPPEIIRKP